MDEHKLLERITMSPQIFGGKPIIRGRRLAVEHVPGWNGKTSRPASSTPRTSPAANELSRYTSRRRPIHHPPRCCDALTD
jgi:hypothetical protein